MAATKWTHPSVVALFEQGITDDPLAWVEQQSRALALEAMEKGWTGPPYDAFQLADALEIDVVARQDLDDARLVVADGQPQIEFNPQRNAARIQFSIAHEIAHTLFADYAERVRYRDRQRTRAADEWQLEVLCNIAAAELLMPPGSLPMSATVDLDLARLLDQRARLGVSTEALLRRVVRLTLRPVALVAAARSGDGPRFRIDYTVASCSWQSPVHAGEEITDTVLARCTAVGYSDYGDGVWNQREVRIQVVGIPPYPGDTFPRLVGLLQPATDVDEHDHGLRYVRGDASRPRADGPAIIAHVVNDQALRWGGQGFAQALKRRFPAARSAYAAWPSNERNLGSVHITPAGPDTPNVWIASMVAQHGYGPSPTGQPRLRLSALSLALRTVAHEAMQTGASVHVPLLGTGQGGTAWPKVRDLLVDELVARGIQVTVYVLPDAAMPQDTGSDGQLALPL